MFSVVSLQFFYFLAVIAELSAGILWIVRRWIITILYSEKLYIPEPSKVSLGKWRIITWSLAVNKPVPRIGFAIILSAREKLKKS